VSLSDGAYPRPEVRGIAPAPHIILTLVFASDFEFLHGLLEFSVVSPRGISEVVANRLGHVDDSSLSCEAVTDGSK